MKRTAWMQSFEARVTALRPDLAGKIEWTSAAYFYNAGMSPDDAAAKYVGAR